MYREYVARGHFITVSAAMLLVFCMIDVVTSYLNLCLGGVELNPFMAPFAGKIIEFTFIKSLYIAFVVMVGSHIIVRIPDLPIGEIWIGTHTTLHAFVVGHNLSIISNWALFNIF